MSPYLSRIGHNNLKASDQTLLQMLFFDTLSNAPTIFPAHNLTQLNRKESYFRGTKKNTTLNLKKKLLLQPDRLPKTAIKLLILSSRNKCIYWSKTICSFSIFSDFSSESVFDKLILACISPDTESSDVV